MALSVMTQQRAIIDDAVRRPVTYLEYFGTYLGYLSTNHMSQHSDTFPANPTLNPRHSTSLLTVELVLFLLRKS